MRGRRRSPQAAAAVLLLGVAACSPGAVAPPSAAPTAPEAASEVAVGQVLRVPVGDGDGREIAVRGVRVTVPEDLAVVERPEAQGVLEVLLPDGERFTLRLEVFPEDDGQDPVATGVRGGKEQFLLHPDVSAVVEMPVEWEEVDRAAGVQGLLEMPDGSRRAVGLVAAAIPQGVLTAYVESETDDLGDAPGLALLGTVRTR